MELSVLHEGGKSEQGRALQAAMNRRLQSRSLAALKVEEDAVVGPATLRSVRTCAWALGAARSTLDYIGSHDEVPIGVSSMIRNPGRRNDAQRKRGRVRVANMRKQRARRAGVLHSSSALRQAIVSVAIQARANYRANPGAYHYLAGGKPSIEIMVPTDRNTRSDCSQFAVNCYRLGNAKCPGAGTFLYSNTISIEGKSLLGLTGRVTKNPRPGDLGMYGAHGRTHHVEVYIGNGTFIGHGSPPIDSLTPGLPDFYLSFLD
jgi:NlpC/P60 family